MMGDSYPTLRVAAVQAAPELLNREATLEKACRLIAEAGARGADLIVFPEGFIPGYPRWLSFYPAGHPQCLRFNRELFKNSVEVPSPTIDQLCQAARQADAYVVMGINERRRGMMGTMYNSQVFIHRSGRLLGKRQKLMPTSGERLVHGLGDGRGLTVFPTEYGALGGLICGENGNPLFRFALAAQGEVIHAASWPSYANPFSAGRKAQEGMLIRMKNYAWESKVFVVSSASIFTEEMAEVLELDASTRSSLQEIGGGSAILGPEGQFLAGPAEYGEMILHAEIDLEAIIDRRLLQDFTGHYNRFDVVSLHYTPVPYEPLYTSSVNTPPPLGDDTNMPALTERGAEGGI